MKLLAAKVIRHTTCQLTVAIDDSIGQKRLDFFFSPADGILRESCLKRLLCSTGTYSAEPITRTCGRHVFGTLEDMPAR